jgi:hypothetical protein
VDISLVPEFQHLFVEKVRRGRYLSIDKVMNEGLEPIQIEESREF